MCWISGLLICGNEEVKRVHSFIYFYLIQETLVFWNRNYLLIKKKKLLFSILGLGEFSFFQLLGFLLSVQLTVILKPL